MKDTLEAVEESAGLGNLSEGEAIRFRAALVAAYSHGAIAGYWQATQGKV